MLEALTYITTEVHRAFKPMWRAGTPDAKAAAGATLTSLLEPLAGALKADYLFGDRPSVADFYLFVMLLWAEKFGVETPAPLVNLRDRIRSRPAVQAALKQEGLI